MACARQDVIFFWIQAESLTHPQAGSACRPLRFSLLALPGQIQSDDRIFYSSSSSSIGKERQLDVGPSVILFTVAAICILSVVVFDDLHRYWQQTEVKTYEKQCLLILSLCVV